MKKALVAALSIALINLTVRAAGGASDPCPTDLTEAKSVLKSAQAPLKKSGQMAKGQQDIQAPRSQQDLPVPHGQDIEAPRVNKAAALVRQAEAACKKGDMAQSSAKAKEALGLLK